MSGLSQLINDNKARVARFAKAAGALASRLRGDSRGNILTIFAIALPLMVGGLGLGVEGANWYQTKRALQNAADEAVVAAATNHSSNYLTEAKAVTAKYGFTNGVANVTVTGNDAATCPDGSSDCYSVTITKKVPLILSQIFGFSGNTTINSSAAELISSTAVASFQTSPRNYCILALANSAPSVDAVEFLTNGAPKANLAGCSIMSNASMRCNGHDLNADYGDAHGTNSGCGNVQTSDLPAVTDSYAPLASNIPANSCSSFPQEPGKKGTPLPASNILGTSGVTTTINLGSKTFCGDVQVAGNVVLTGSNVITIVNGRLDVLSSSSITTDTGAAATVIFTGTNDSTYTHTPTGGGTINISSPTSGPWSGVAIYTDPNLTTGVDMSAAGNSPSWNLSGLAYFPHASVTFSGAVGKATSGHSCFVLVVDSITINGTGNILNRGECDQQGLVMPNSEIPNRGRLVA
jgi:Flp pilus assembly protein TadG